MSTWYEVAHRHGSVHFQLPFRMESGPESAPAVIVASGAQTSSTEIQI